jgi:hypothetical protein
MIFFISYQNGKFYKEVLGLSNDISCCSIGVDLGPSKHCLKVGSDFGSLTFNPSNGHNYIYRVMEYKLILLHYFSRPSNHYKGLKLRCPKPKGSQLP